MVGANSFYNSGLSCFFSRVLNSSSSSYLLLVLDLDAAIEDEDEEEVRGRGGDGCGRVKRGPRRSTIGHLKILTDCSGSNDSNEFAASKTESCCGIAIIQVAPVADALTLWIA